MAISAPLLRAIRLVHLYVGVVIAPALLFFAITGALQTAGLHETIRGSNYQPPHWIVVLAQIHKKQTADLPPRRPPAAAAPNSNSAQQPQRSEGKPTTAPQLTLKRLRHRLTTRSRSRPFFFWFRLVSSLPRSAAFGWRTFTIATSASSPRFCCSASFFR